MQVRTQSRQSPERESIPLIMQGRTQSRSHTVARSPVRCMRFADPIVECVIEVRYESRKGRWMPIEEGWDDDTVMQLVQSSSQACAGVRVIIDEEDLPASGIEHAIGAPMSADGLLLIALEPLSSPPPASRRDNSILLPKKPPDHNAACSACLNEFPSNSVSSSSTTASSTFPSSSVGSSSTARSFGSEAEETETAMTTKVGSTSSGGISTPPMALHDHAKPPEDPVAVTEVSPVRKFSHRRARSSSSFSLYPAECDGELVADL